MGQQGCSVYNQVSVGSPSETAPLSIHSSSWLDGLIDEWRINSSLCSSDPFALAYRHNQGLWLANQFTSLANRLAHSESKMQPEHRGGALPQVRVSNKPPVMTIHSLVFTFIHTQTASPHCRPKSDYHITRSIHPFSSSHGGTKRQKYFFLNTYQVYSHTDVARVRVRHYMSVTI